MRYGIYFKSGKDAIFTCDHVVGVDGYIYLMSRISDHWVTEIMVANAEVLYVKRMPDETHHARATQSAKTIDPPVAPVVPTDRHSLAETLSRDQHTVMRLRGAGKSYKEISMALGTGEAGVEYHVAQIKKKLGITGRTEFVDRCKEWYPPEGLEQPSHLSFAPS